MWLGGSASQTPPSPAVAAGPHPAARSVSAQCRLSMCPPRGLLLVATLVLLDHLSLARNLPTTTPGPGMFQCLQHSQKLLRAVSTTLQKFKRCPLAFLLSRKSFLSNESCLASTETSFMMTQCLRSIYEDLKMYQLEFRAMNEKLLMDPKRQIFLDQNMLALIDKLMQALNFNSETAPQKSSLEELDFYKTKIKLCILLHAFRIRVVTIDRVMSYLNSS
ncbi:interleukin-12 subunit alpha isoform X2 [Eulemur rufifrons]|uniref:interleukin-12 subunit alpha isoform X2 n=1 Tax=Eulemur rufifrons TaxID=859984 RepID=UPI003743F4D7